MSIHIYNNVTKKYYDLIGNTWVESREEAWHFTDEGSAGIARDWLIKRLSDTALGTDIIRQRIIVVSV